MPEVKTGLYEILVRFNCEKGEKFGRIRGVARIMATYAVDEDGNIMGLIGHEQKDIPQDQVSEILGKEINDLTLQLDEQKALVADKDREISSITGDRANMANLLKSVDEANGSIMQENARLRVANEDLKGQVKSLNEDNEKRKNRVAELEEQVSVTIDETGTKIL